MNHIGKWILCFLLGYVGRISASIDQPNVTNTKLKFGAKLGYELSLFLSQPTVCIPIELFTVYHSKATDKDYKPLLGWYGNSHINYAIQTGICYTSRSSNTMRKDIEPAATFFLYPHQEIGSIYFNVKMISFPIAFKSYWSKNRNFAIVFRFAPILILSVYKEDWVAELSNQYGQKLLKEYIYRNNRSYHERDPNHIKDRKSFYNQWNKRQAKDKRTYLNVNTVFNGRMGFEFSLLGIEYETDYGFIVNWNVLNISYFSKGKVAIASMFSIGYNLSL
mgnify:CR=1 FL=1